MRVACTLYALYLGVQKREGWEQVGRHLGTRGTAIDRSPHPTPAGTRPQSTT